MLSADEAVAEATGLLRGTPTFLVGSCVAAQFYAKPQAFSDVDIFTPSAQVIMTTVQLMLDNGFTMNERMTRTWYRWQHYGFANWKTNSIRLHSLSDTEYNVVYKLVDGHPTTSLGQVLESFDFGYLAIGYDLEYNEFGDGRSFYFPNVKPGDPYPLFKDKRANWIQGFFSYFTGMRQPERYAKSVTRGYDMSLVGPDLALGFRMSALYHHNHEDESKHLIGDLWDEFARMIEDDEIDELTQFYKTINKYDALDRIMEALV